MYVTELQHNLREWQHLNYVSILPRVQLNFTEIPCLEYEQFNIIWEPIEY